MHHVGGSDKSQFKKDLLEFSLQLAPFNVVEAQWKLFVYKQRAVPGWKGNACSDGHTDPSL